MHAVSLDIATSVSLVPKDFALLLLPNLIWNYIIINKGIVAYQTAPVMDYVPVVPHAVPPWYSFVYKVFCLNLSNKIMIHAVLNYCWINWYSYIAICILDFFLLLHGYSQENDHKSVDGRPKMNNNHILGGADFILMNMQVIPAL